MTASTEQKLATTKAAPLDWDTLRALCAAADVDHPAPGALDALRTFLVQHPQSWQIVGDLGGITRVMMLDQLVALPSLQLEVQARLHGLRSDLQREGESVVEQLAIEAILTAWLDYQLTALRFSKSEQSGMTFKQAEHWQKRLTRTQARYLRALETLARIRKLGISIQVNIAAAGGQQINVAGSSEGEAARRSG
jgi:hypothetical protein